jgi:peptide/nickel transport system permease protein
MSKEKNTSRFWKRFRKNKAAILALCFIFFTILIAVFAYPLSPDNTPNANRMLVEISTQKPGYTCLFLKKTKNQVIESSNAIQFLLYGQETNYDLIPIKSFTLQRDSILVNHIIDDETQEKLAFSLQEWNFNSSLSHTEIEDQLIIKKTFWLGTDRFGRDMLSRLLIGTRVSLAVGFIAVLLSVCIGLFLGAVSGYFGGWADQFITWLINVIWAIPTLLLVFAITFVLGKGFWQIFIAVGLTMWVGTARLIRGQVMALKELEYIQVAKTMGYSSFRIIVKHILPNVLGPTMVMAASNFATAILIEAGLSFLGIGVQPPASSWGLMIKENYNFIITNRPLLAIIPGIAIMLIVLAFNILGNALRDALDVKG